MTTDATSQSTEIGRAKVKRAALLIIGNEILSGRTQDVNLNHIAKALGSIGVRLGEARVIADDAPRIVAAVRELSDGYDYVFTTGGIGPTHDDITADCVAQAFGVDIGEHPEAMRRLGAHYAAQGTEFNAPRRRMARIPHGADLIDNPVSVAPGFRIGNVHVMAGVPRIMQAMLAGILPTLTGGPLLLSRTIACELPEGAMAEGLAAIQDRYLQVEIGSYPGFARARFKAQIVLRSVEIPALDAATEEVMTMIRSLGDAPVLMGESDNAPEAA